MAQRKSPAKSRVSKTTPRKRKVKARAVQPQPEPFVASGVLPSGEVCPTYCPQCIPKDLDISDDGIELWETYSSGWISTPICTTCRLAIPVKLDWTPLIGNVKTVDAIANTLVGVDTRAGLAEVLAQLLALEEIAPGLSGTDVLERLWSALERVNRWKLEAD